MTICLINSQSELMVLVEVPMEKFFFLFFAVRSPLQGIESSRQSTIKVVINSAISIFFYLKFQVLKFTPTFLCILSPW